MEALDRVIWSADVGTLSELMKFLRMMPNLRYVKIDRLFVEANGLDVLKLLSDMGLKVFADGKIVEVPSKVLQLARLHLERRPWMLNCMAGICSTGVLENPDDPNLVDGLKQFADACHTAGTLPCGVTVLTSKTPEVVALEYNLRLDPDNEGAVSTQQVLTYVEMLNRFGFTDVVCSPKEVVAIRSDHRFDHLNLNTPGIRPVGMGKDDQARTDTPAAAIRAGATRLIIGRPIHAKGDPAENLHGIVAEIEEALATS